MHLVQSLLIGSAICCASGAAASAEDRSCPPFSVSMIDGYRAIGDPAFWPAQPAGALWRFRAGSPSGPLLQSIGSGALTNSAGHWGDLSQPYTVPTAGPIYSEVPENNEIGFFRRAPSFTGIMLHPGLDDSRDSVATFEAPAQMVLTGMSLVAEDLGAFNGAIISAGVHIGGVSTTLIGPTFIAPAPAAAINLSASGGLPIVLNAGDSAWVRTNRNGDASEDWINVDMTLTFVSGPIILAPPLARIACPGATWKAPIDARGAATYRWRKGTMDLTDGPTGTGSTISGSDGPALHITNVSLSDVALYSCRVVGECGEAVSVDVTPVLRCPGDADPNSIVEFADITAVLANFGATYPPTIAGRGDADCSGVVDFADVTRVLALFGVPCP